LTCLLALPSHGAETEADGRLPDMLPIRTVWQPLLCLDVGTGAGFPGLPLKIVRPELRLTLLEATEEKTTFLRHVVERLGLEGIEIVTARAEELGQVPYYRERYDAVLARAVAELPVLAEYCLPFCRVGGRFIAQKGAQVEVELRQAQRALTILGGEVRELKEVNLPEMVGRRSLVIIDKVSPTPASYPRRQASPANDS